jgi:hypothetical protein
MILSAGASLGEDDPHRVGFDVPRGRGASLVVRWLAERCQPPRYGIFWDALEKAAWKEVEGVKIDGAAPEAP